MILDGVVCLYSESKTEQKVVALQRLFVLKALHIARGFLGSNPRSRGARSEGKSEQTSTKGKSTYGKPYAGKTYVGKTCAGKTNLGKSRTSKY